jgi:ABC-2 type transport system permease protein
MVALAGTELRLYFREWGMLVFAFVLPPLMMLVLAGVFASDGYDSVFGATDGTDFYIASYLGVPLASVALTGLPVMLAGYRELGVLRRFAASGIGARAVVSAQAVVCLASVLLGAVAVVVVAAPVYGLPAVQHPPALLAVLLLGAATLLTMGVSLGLAVRSVRVANSVGMLFFFPMFILGGGGPPEGVMTGAMRDIADVLPLSHVTRGLRDAWLFGSGVGQELRWLAGWLAVSLALLALVSRFGPARSVG